MAAERDSNAPDFSTNEANHLKRLENFAGQRAENGETRAVSELREMRERTQKLFQVCLIRHVTTVHCVSMM
jgi:hypothetical protein